MALFLHHMKRRLLILPSVILALGIMLWITGAFSSSQDQYTIHSAMANIEIYAFLISGLCSCFLLHNRDETEMAVICGTSPVKLLICQYVPILIYSYPPVAVYSLILFDSFMWPRLFLSYAITLIFITSLGLLGRLILNNTYASTGIMMFFYILFAISINDRIFRLSIPIGNARFDPYITNYAHIRRFLPDGTIWEVSQGMWEGNRLLFGVLALAILIACFILVKLERVYRR